MQVSTQPVDPTAVPDTGDYPVVHGEGNTSVVVPLADFLRLRALEQQATVEALEDAEDAAALADWRAREASGRAVTVPMDEVRRRLGLPQ